MSLPHHDYPSLRTALSVVSRVGWPIECWGVSIAFLYARLVGDRDADLGRSEIFMRPLKIVVEAGVAQPRPVTRDRPHHSLAGKLNAKRLYSPLSRLTIAWSTACLPAQVLMFRPGDDLT